MHKSRISREAMLAEFTRDEALLLDLEAQRYHHLNETAATVWKAAKQAVAAPHMARC